MDGTPMILLFIETPQGMISSFTVIIYDNIVIHFLEKS